MKNTDTTVTQAETYKTLTEAMSSLLTLAEMAGIGFVVAMDIGDDESGQRATRVNIAQGASPRLLAAVNALDAKVG